MKRRVWRVLAAVGIACGAACVSTPARLSLAVPLEIPEPPPHAALDPMPPAEPPAEPVPVPASRPTAEIPAPNPPPTTIASAPVPPPAPAVQVLEPPRVTPPPDLLPAGQAGRKQTAAQVREILVRTKQKLDSIDPRRLNAGKRADYDSARRFLAQAEAAVTANNLMLAESSAEKADTLANGLK